MGSSTEAVIGAALALTLPPNIGLMNTLDGSVLRNAAKAAARELAASLVGKRTNEETNVLVPALTVPLSSTSNPGAACFWSAMLTMVTLSTTTPAAEAMERVYSRRK